MISKTDIMKIYRDGILMEQTQDALQSHDLALQALDILFSTTGDILNLILHPLNSKANRQA